MSNIAIKGAATGSGTFTLEAPATSTNRTLTLPDAAGTILTTATAGVPIGGPAFSAYQSTLQSVSNATFTKVVLQAEEFDTATAFDNATNYRFTPLIAGYYQVNGVIGWSGGTNSGQSMAYLYKNGSQFKISSGSVGNATNDGVHALVYLNGSTDYIELFCYQSGGVAKNTQTGLAQTYFQAAMVRSAT